VVIEVDKVRKVYSTSSQTFTALDEISFSMTEGEFVCLVGPSGCGKSTLLQVLGGLLRATSGTVRVDGQPVVDPLPGKIALVFQEPLLLPWKTALDNVKLPLEIRGADSAVSDARARSMLDLVGLLGFSDRYPHELSGGMQQRVSIARGLAQEPRIILMDEPFGALDEQTRVRMGEELTRIRLAARKTIFFVTHSLSEAIYLSDRILVMGTNPGRILDELKISIPRGRPMEMMEAAEFSKLRSHIWKLISPDSVSVAA
jgi:NitT/TauT family transport system ATP-binding protein